MKDPRGRLGAAACQPIRRPRRHNLVIQLDHAGQLTFAGGGPGHELRLVYGCFEAFPPKRACPVPSHRATSHQLPDSHVAPRVPAARLRYVCA